MTNLSDYTDSRLENHYALYECEAPNIYLWIAQPQVG